MGMAMETRKWIGAGLGGIGVMERDFVLVLRALLLRYLLGSLNLSL